MKTIVDICDKRTDEVVGTITYEGSLSNPVFAAAFEAAYKWHKKNLRATPRRSTSR